MNDRIDELAEKHWQAWWSNKQSKSVCQRMEDALRELAAEKDAEIEGLRRTFKLWQKDSDTLAAEFPGVDWTHCADFVPHVRALRVEISELKANLGDVRTAYYNESDALRAQLLALQQVCDKQKDYIQGRPCDCRFDKYSGKLLAQCQRCAALDTKPDLSLLEEVRKVLADVVENAPCSDPDCCEFAIACEKARTNAEKLLTKLGHAI